MLDAQNKEIVIGDEVELTDVSNVNPFQWKQGEKCLVAKIGKTSYGKYAVLQKKNSDEALAIFFSHEFQKI